MVGPKYSGLGKIESKGAGFARRVGSSVAFRLGKTTDVDEAYDCWEMELTFKKKIIVVKNNCLYFCIII